MSHDPFPTVLRRHRLRRHLSQLELASRAGTTQRHISFIESGRSTPGRTMVVRIAEALELPLRERNRVLGSAGFAPAYDESPVESVILAPAVDALTAILGGHDPYPAIITGRAGALIAVNTSFSRLVRHSPPELSTPGANAYRLALHPDGLGGRVLNLGQWGRHVLDRIDHAANADASGELADLRRELEAHVPDLGVEDAGLGFAVPVRLRADDGGELRLMTTVSTFATATDVTLAELKLEAFLPADAETAARLAQEA